MLQKSLLIILSIISSKENGNEAKDDLKLPISSDFIVTVQNGKTYNSLETKYKNDQLNTTSEHQISLKTLKICDSNIQV